MADLTSLDAPINAETLIKEARAAREQKAADQVATYVRAALSSFKSPVKTINTDE